MALNLQPNESPTGGTQAEDHGVQHVTGYGFLPVGDDKDTCKKKAESGGGYAWDEHAQACWMIFGKAVHIWETEHSIQEGFEVVNFNFRANGSQPPVPTQLDLPGSSDTAVQSPNQGGIGSPGWNSDTPQTGVGA